MMMMHALTGTELKVYCRSANRSSKRMLLYVHTRLLTQNPAELAPACFELQGRLLCPRCCKVRTKYGEFGSNFLVCFFFSLTFLFLSLELTH